MPVKVAYREAFAGDQPGSRAAIQPAPTHVTAFVGRAPAGPLDMAVRVSSLEEFQRKFGGLEAAFPLGYAVKDFFANGGAVAVIARLFEPAQDDGFARLVFPLAALPPSGVKLAAPIREGDSKLALNTRLDGIVAVGDGFTVAGVPTFYTVDQVTAAGEIRFQPDAATEIASGAAITFHSTLTLRAASPGAWGNRLEARVSRVRGPLPRIARDHGLEQADLFNLRLTLRNGHGKVIASELHRNVSVLGRDRQGAYPGRLDYVLATQSALAQVEWLPALPPAAGQVARGGNGNDGAGLTPLALLGDRAAKRGIFLLETTDIFNLLCIPPDGRMLPDVAAQGHDLDPEVRRAAAEYCTERRAFFIVDPPTGWKDLAAQGQQGAIDPASLGIAGVSPSGRPLARNCAVYFPHLLAEDPLAGGGLARFPPSGAIAGVMARTDTMRGVWAAPAGEAAGLAGVAELDMLISDAVGAQLNARGINCLRNFTAMGPVVWGERTLSGADASEDDYKYVADRRFVLFVEESLYRGTQWVMFEESGEPLWSSLRDDVGAFLAGLAKQGALHDYAVTCDATNNPPGAIAEGMVAVTVKLWLDGPAEFHVLQIQQQCGAGQMPKAAT
ncbi:MAG: phage tail sheath family protein [Proteobacteria bacterium]|nr:phage tail sheath family protein [Pseudomonadota bacterium]